MDWWFGASNVRMVSIWNMSKNGFWRTITVRWVVLINVFLFLIDDDYTVLICLANIKQDMIVDALFSKYIDTKSNK